MTQKEIFIEAHKKACGKSVYAKQLEDFMKTLPDVKSHSEVYLNEFGNEVHVNGPVAESLMKEETLQERIARFDRLADTVAAIRMARSMGLIEGETDEFEEDVNDDSLLDDIEIRDDFGDIVEKVSVAEPKNSASAAQTMPAASVSGDEPVDASGTDSGMQSDDSVVD